MYEVKLTSERFQSFGQAVIAAASVGSEVYEIETGLRCWSPPAEVSAERMQMYKERLAAYHEQQRSSRIKDTV